MTAFRTCKNCVGDGACDLQRTLMGKLSGLHITSVKHRCAARVPLFKVGQRVSVTWPVGDFDEGYSNESWSATVISESGPRFLIKVDDGDSDCGTPATEHLKNPSLFARTTAARLTALDEPVQTICETCQHVGDGGFGENGCYGQRATSGFGSYRPARCAAIAKATSPSASIGGS